MLINPLKNEVSKDAQPQDISKVDAISEIISYLINNYSDTGADVSAATVVSGAAVVSGSDLINMV